MELIKNKEKEDLIIVLLSLLKIQTEQVVMNRGYSGEGEEELEIGDREMIGD